MLCFDCIFHPENKEYNFGGIFPELYTHFFLHRMYFDCIFIQKTSNRIVGGIFPEFYTHFYIE